MEGTDSEAACPEKFHESFRNRHQKEADRLRSEIEGLVRQANVMLHGNARHPPRPKVGGGRNEGLLEATIEKSAWYRHEIKRLRRDLENWDRLCSGPTCNVGAQDRDPMETYNLLVERRKELQKLQRNGHGLDRVAAAQRRAETEQNALSPEVDDRLRHAKDEAEKQKRLHVRMTAERQKVVTAKKKAEQEMRTANKELRTKAAQLQRPPRPTKAVAHVGGAREQLKHLQRDVDILSEAVWQDERKHKVSQVDDETQIEHTRTTIAKLRATCASYEAQISKLRAEAGGTGDEPTPDFSAPVVPSPRGLGGISERSPREQVLSPPPPKALKSQASASKSPASVASRASPQAAVASPTSVAASPSVNKATPSTAQERIAAIAARMDSQAPEMDAEESDDMAALVAPSPRGLNIMSIQEKLIAADLSNSRAGSKEPLQKLGSKESLSAQHVGCSNFNIQEIGAKLAEAGLSGALQQKLHDAQKTNNS